MINKPYDETPNRKKPLRQRLKDWFNRIPGQALLDVEKSQLDEELLDLFGYHIIQLGDLGAGRLIERSRIPHKLLFDISPQDTLENGDLACHSAYLPIDASSVDVVLLPHVLEFENDPHEILREVERILIGEGHVIVLGLNPFSLWGICHAILAWRDNPPWNGHFYRAARIRDWLGLLGFEVVKTKCLFYRPPFGSAWLMKKFEFLERLGNYLWPWLGGGYLIIGKKRLLPLMPIKTEWRIRRRLIASGITEPTSRVREIFKKNN